MAKDDDEFDTSLSVKQDITPETLETEHNIKIFQAVSRCDPDCPLWEECDARAQDLKCVKEQRFLEGKVQELVCRLQDTGIDPWQKDTAGMVLPTLYSQFFRLTKHSMVNNKVLYGDKNTAKVKADPILKELRNVMMDITKATTMLMAKKKGSHRQGGTVFDNIYE